MGRVAPGSWKQQYFRSIKDLIDQHQPDLLYADGGIPFDEYGLSLVAHHYNVSAKRHGGRVDAVHNSKVQQDCDQGTCTLDLERGIVDKIRPIPWQTDTGIGNWHYKRDITCKTPKIVMDMFVDIVSRNGNLLLNFPPAGKRTVGRPGTAVNKERIYGTRPWKILAMAPALCLSRSGLGASGSTRAAVKT